MPEIAYNVNIIPLTTASNHNPVMKPLVNINALPIKLNGPNDFFCLPIKVIPIKIESEPTD